MPKLRWTGAVDPVMDVSYQSSHIPSDPFEVGSTAVPLYGVNCSCDRDTTPEIRSVSGVPADLRDAPELMA